MSSALKTLISLLISILLTLGCMIFVFAGGIKFIEVKFYEPRVLENINERLNSVNSAFEDYSKMISRQIEGYVSEKTVASYFQREVTEAEGIARTDFTGRLMEKNPGIEGIRLLENDGIHIHFSTFPDDILREDEDIISYKNYDVINEIPFSRIQIERVSKKTEIHFDQTRNRIIYTYPFYDEYDIFRAEYVFYFSGDDFTRYLINRDLISLNSRAVVIENKGIVFGLPVIGRDILIQQILEKWNRNLSGAESLVRTDEDTLFLVSKKASLFTGEIHAEGDFTFSREEKLLLLVSIFITLFLVIFIIFNIRHDDNVVITSRIKKFQYSLLREYIDRKDSSDWASLAKEIARRKMELNSEIKKSLGNRGKKHSQEVDALLDKSWTEVMAALAGPVSLVSGGNISAHAEVVNEIEEVPEAEPVEELEEVPEAEPVEELEEVPEAEPVEELEEVPEAEPVEELEEVPEAEPVEELEEVPETEPVEELEEVPPAEPVTEHIEIKEQTLDEFRAENELEQEDQTESEDTQKRRQESEEKFSVVPLDFTSLDAISSELSSGNADKENTSNE